MRVYIAGPYTKGDVGVNVAKAIEAGDQVLNAGHTPFIPHLNHFWHIIYPHPESSWLSYDNVWLMTCDALIRLPGESKGADTEVQIAQFLPIPVFYSFGEFLDYVRGS